jgi:vacuolar-type H+-ATPase subunit E/Vma4
MIVALTDVQLRKSSVTLERLEDYKELIETATNDLEARLENIDEKLGTLMARTATSAETTELQSIKDERSSTQKCLLICAQLSELIEQLRPTTTGGTSRDGDGIPEKITSDGIKKCRTSMEETTARLEKHMQDILDRMMSKSMTTMAQDDAKYLARLREDWTTARQCRDILSEADHRLKENISVIDNHATGDETVQLLVSNSQKTIHGKNRGYGFQIKQLGGHLSDESIQKVSGDFLQMSLRRSGSTGQPGSGDALFEGPEENERRPNWQPQYGNGRKLQS